MIEWVPIVGYEGWYEVSEQGQVRRIRPGTSARIGRPLCLNPSGSGHIGVVLYRDGVRRRHLVHRLVAGAFIGPCPPGYFVNHKDGRPANNDRGNLEYVTPAQNQQHARDVLGRYRSEDSATVKLDAQKVTEMAALYEQGHSIADLARRYNVSYHAVWDIFRRKRTWRNVMTFLANTDNVQQEATDDHPE